MFSPAKAFEDGYTLVDGSPRGVARAAMLAALADMPDEAFGWFVMAARPSSQPGFGNARIWPDGVGGFMSESRAAIEAVRAAAETWIEASAPQQ